MGPSGGGMEKLRDDLFENALAACAARMETVLSGLLDNAVLDGEIHRPARLVSAMRHGVLNGGKRIRPFLLVETAQLFDCSDDAVWRVAAALECVHCYSLIHDDLPAMDDDDIRRGQPTVHKAFDEATAILAGDSLLTFAFDILAARQTDLAAETKADLVVGLARASGLGGMAGGQMLDLAAAGEGADEAEIIRLQAMKTGALIRYACEAGAVVSGARAEDRARMAEFGSAIGLAFQLADDLLDLTADSAVAGKQTGKDAAHGKATLAGLHGEAWTRRQLAGLVDQANDLLDPYGEKALILTAAAQFVAERRH